MSDIHLEFAPLRELALPPTDKEGILVLAGDICPYNSREFLLVPFLKEMAGRFRKVLYILGNHEFYGYGSLDLGHRKVRQIIRGAQLANVHLLENRTLVVDNVAFIGATLWTDFNKGDPNLMFLATRHMADYGEIVCNTAGGAKRRITPEDVYRLHVRSRRYIFRAAKREHARGRRSVIIVHHGVSALSVNRRFTGDPLNGCFVSDLSKEILDAEPNLVIHGHVHYPADYLIGNTRVVANPRGYPGENKAWNPNLVLEI